MRAVPFLKKLASSAALVFASVHTFAADPAPRILREPVLGLHYEPAQAKFDALPPQALVHCETLGETAYRRSEWSMYAKARDASGRTFYIAGSYDEWLDGRPAHRKFDNEDLGLVFYHDSGTCVPVDAARDVFDQHMVDAVLTPTILKQLAVDLIHRLERAFGSQEQLKLELRNQRINFDLLPPALREAMSLYVTASHSADRAPRILREPVFGLRFERAKVKFDPVPTMVVANCGEVLTDTLSKNNWYVFGQASDASGRAYYVTGGYQEMLDGRPASRRFLTEEPGMVFYTDQKSCQYMDLSEILCAGPEFVVR